MANFTVRRNKAFFDGPPRAVPAGNVDVSGNGRWKIWQYAGTKIDAPILGNGSMLSAMAGNARYPQFWITTNDFWQMESAANWEFFHDNETAKHDPAVCLGSPKPVGRMVFDIPCLDGCKVQVEQDFYTATTTARYMTGEEEVLRIHSYVAATENILIIGFEPEKDVELIYDFFFPDETGKGCDQGVDIWGSGEGEEIRNGMFVGLAGAKPIQYKKVKNGLVSGYRQFSEMTDMPVKAGFAGCFLEAELREQTDEYLSTKKRLAAGRSYHFVLPLRTWRKVSRPYEYARSRASWMELEDEAALRRQHLKWWEDFWSISEITLDDPLIEQRYYLSHYMFASLSRDPDYPPNILGISTFDRMAWNGNYKINYNHQSPYLGQLTAGHFLQSDPHDAPFLDMLDITREMSRRLLGHKGVYYPLGLGPHGMVSEALLLYMKSPAVHGALNMIMRYELTQDDSYLEKVKPFLLSVADFWEKDLVLRDGVYHVVGDGMHERITANIRAEGMPEDPVNTLGYLKTFFAFMEKYGDRLGADEEQREKWAKRREKLAPYPSGTIRMIKENPTLWAEADVELERLVPPELLDKKVYYDEGKGGKWSLHFPGNVMHIYPGNAISLGSDQEELETAYNTVWIHGEMENRLAKILEEEDRKKGIKEKVPHFYKAGAWNASNLSCLFFPAAVRVGYDPEIIWKELSDMIVYRGLPNGFLDRNPHGIEELNTVPCTIQEMMLQSHENIIRIFPVWPVRSHPNASFRGFYAYGAWRVSAALAAGEVERAELTKEKGGRVLVENPWKGREVCLLRENGEKEILRGEILKVVLNPCEKGILMKN